MRRNPAQVSVTLLLCLLSAYAMGQTRFAELLKMEYEPPDEIVRYGDSEFQYAEYWHGRVPDSPLVIIIHGGCWLNAYNAEHVRPLASALNAKNYAVWSVEYRRVGDDGGGWPGSFDDIIAGINRAATLGGIDKEKVVLLGHSAGGHMALWAAASAGFPAESPFYNKLQLKIKGVIGLAAISNLNEYAAGNSSCEKATSRLLGGMPEAWPARYRFASPHLLSPHALTVLIHGGNDTIVPPGQSGNFHPNSEFVEVVPVSNMGHFDVINPDTIVFEKIRIALEKIL